MVRMLGHHELLIRLASGGAANVFLVRDTAVSPPGRLLALKILLPSLAANDDFLNMFFTEARIAARLEHPNIVAIAGFGQTEGIHCLAMEYVFGASLAQVLRASARAKKPLTVGVLLRITAQVCDALHYAHELQDENGKPMGLVHRDVTPQNILIGFNGVPKLTDFGIAKATNRGWETQAGIVKGKFSYMSPEQALGKKVDRRSDIFGAGIVLWEALTGRDLFRGSSPLEVLTAIREQKIEPPSKVVPGLTPIVDPIVMKALRRSPKQRYQSALEMKKDIEDLIERAGVTIDASTISREFAAIYGNEIVDRAFALRAAMAGKPNIDHLAEVLGGTKLSAKHLPVIPGGVTNPDPLGLFSEPSAGQKEGEGTKNGTVLPARVEQQFKIPSGPPPGSSQRPEALDEVEIIENADEAAIDLADIARLEAEQEESFEETDSGEHEPPKYERMSKRLSEIMIDKDVVESPIRGWDDSTAMSVPSDELLSMLSEDDATVGYLPEAFAERFGRELKKALDDGGEATVDQSEPSFEDELTIGMPGGQDIAKLRQLQREVTPNPWSAAAGGAASPPIGIRRFEFGVSAAATEPKSKKGVTLRPIPRAPSLDLESARSRPVPRAPSLDMEDAMLTPLPDLEEISDPVLPSRPQPGMPPPPPRAFASGELTPPPSPTPRSVHGFTLKPLEPPIDSDSGPAQGSTLRNHDAEPSSMPGVPVISDDGGPDPTTPGYDLRIEESSYNELAPSVASVPGNGAAHDTVDYTDSEQGDQALPPQFPDVLRALETASQPEPEPEDDLADPNAPPVAIQTPPLATSKPPTPPPMAIPLNMHRPQRAGIELTPMVLVVMILGLVALGMVIGILLTKT
jgi:serine/threonine protein kinase